MSIIARSQVQNCITIVERSRSARFVKIRFNHWPMYLISFTQPSLFFKKVCSSGWKIWHNAFLFNNARSIFHVLHYFIGLGSIKFDSTTLSKIILNRKIEYKLSSNPKINTINLENQFSIQKKIPESIVIEDSQKIESKSSLN